MITQIISLNQLCIIHEWYYILRKKKKRLRWQYFTNSNGEVNVFKVSDFAKIFGFSLKEKIWCQLKSESLQMMGIKSRIEWWWRQIETKIKKKEYIAIILGANLMHIQLVECLFQNILVGLPLHTCK